jgi:putative DNA primase/helicase
MMAKIIPEKNTNNDAKAIKISQPATTDQGAQPLPETAITATGAPVTQESDDDVIERLAAMKPLEYERARVEHAKQMGCRPTVLDDLVKAARRDCGESSSLPFAEAEPCPSEVDPALLLNEVAATIRIYIVLDEEQADAAALWVALTWFIDVVEVAPLAMMNAPEKSCGKSLLLDVIGRMSARPLPVSNATTAGLFRSVEL